MAAGRGLYRDSRPSGERNKLQAVPDACPLTSTFSSALSPPARILADQGYLNGGVVQPSPARELGSLFSVFYYYFFFGRVIVVHIYPIARGAWQALIHMWQRVGHK